MRMTTRLMMTAVAVTVARTLERVALLSDRAAAVVIRYTMTPKTIEKVRAICGGKKERHISAGHY
jgi:pyruvate-formate lyase-activating enzyme